MRLKMMPLLAFGSWICSGGLQAQVAGGGDKPSIVLVHGAFADGSSWDQVIPILQRNGYSVTAVQNSLASFAGDVENTRRVIEAQPGSVVVVGHSYGGAVITEAAADLPRVKALVYVAAFGPEPGEAIGALYEKYPVELTSALVPDAAGFVYVDRSRFHALFAQDVPEAEANVIAAVQKPIIGSAFIAAPSRAAWKAVPTFYLLTLLDGAIHPEAQRFYARRMNATTVEIRSSHVPFLSHPREVARLIEQAAGRRTP